MADTAPEAGAPPALADCPHCGAHVPVGTFCGNCGAHLTDTGGRVRLHHFAAAPNEHVARTAVISTLFPHLPHRHAHVFREALLIGVVVVVLLAAVHLFAPALLVAAVLLPVLYLLYLYEVEVYEHDPLLVLGATFIAGALLGVAYTLVISATVKTGLLGTGGGALLIGVLLPIVVQLLMLAGPLLLLGHRSFDETLDGLTFGVASALGFTMAAVITGYWHVLTAQSSGSGSFSAEAVASILRVAILAAIVNATTTGMVTGAIWLRRRAVARERHRHPIRDLPMTLVIAFGAQIALGLISFYVPSLLVNVVIWAVAAALLIVWLRVLLHYALLDEGAEVGIGPASPCPECHRLVPMMLFCPACGVARSVGPKHARTATTAQAVTVGH